MRQICSEYAMDNYVHLNQITTCLKIQGRVLFVEDLDTQVGRLIIQASVILLLYILFPDGISRLLRERLSVQKKGKTLK